MRLFFFFIYAVLLFPVLTEANDILQILFNDDYADYCNDSEWYDIDDAIYILSQNQRSLRGIDNGKRDLKLQPLVHRSLGWPNSCANRCAGFTAKTCKALNCVGYRRRSLFWASDCNNQISEVNNLLNNLRENGGFSDSCWFYLSLDRIYNCFTDEYCEPFVEDGVPEDGDDNWDAPIGEDAPPEDDWAPEDAPTEETTPPEGDDTWTDDEGGR